MDTEKRMELIERAQKLEVDKVGVMADEVAFSVDEVGLLSQF